jgi:nitrite reductase/ring-hydroxylating ferredoxin subunit
MSKEIIVFKSEFKQQPSTVKFTYELKNIKHTGFVVLNDGSYNAYKNQCMHLPVELDWQDNNFLDEEGKFIICATHGAIYNLEEGYCVSGPCQGMKLKAMAVEEVIDRLIIKIEAE